MREGLVDGAPTAEHVRSEGGSAIAEHFRRAVAGAPIGIVCIDCVKGQYVFVNECYARMVGRSLEEVLASDPYQMSVDATHPEDRQTTRETTERIAKGELDRHRYEKRMLSKSGEVRWVAIDQLAARNAAGRLAFLTLFFSDIQERMSAAAMREKLEDELRQAQKLEALGKLAGGVAHDFNNRLVVMMGYAELLKDCLPGASPLHGHAEQVLQSAQRASELTRQLLAYSRRQVLNPQTFDLNAAVDKMRRLLERLIGEDIELVTTLAATSPIHFDPGQIEQVIINLAVNARDAMPRGGRLSLETRDVQLAAGEQSPLAAGAYVALIVSDSGLGIELEVLPRIFEPFFTTKEIGHGTGLGLATVEGIVRQSGGAVQVESGLGQGTTFTVHLPCARAQSAAPLRERAEVSTRDSAPFETVLVCEDDDHVRQLIANVLSFRAYTVLQARSGREALELVAAHAGPIHLLVTDLVMPGIGGLELAAELRRRQPGLRVLYMSGYTEHAALLSGPLELGTQFLAKPFLPSTLTQTVCTLLEQQAAP